MNIRDGLQFKNMVEENMKKHWIAVLILVLLGVLLGEEYLKDRVNVKFKVRPSERQITQIEKKFKLEKISEIKEIQVVSFRIKDKTPVSEMIRRLEAYPTVEYAEPEFIYRMDQKATVKKVSQEEQTTTEPVASQEPFYRITSVEYVPGEILVKYKEAEKAEAVTALAEKLGTQVVETIPRLNLQRCRIVTEMTMDSVLAAYRADPNVEYAEPNYILHALEIPNDPHFTKLWGLNNEGQTGGTFDADIDAPEAWDKQKGSQDVIVSIIDTGVDYTHPDLADNMWTNPGEIPNNGVDDDNNGFVDDYRGWDFANNDSDPKDDNRHGTHVAGTIGAVGNNARGVTGVCWTIRLMPLKFLDAGGSGSTSNAVKAIIYAVDNGAKILSNSWGGGGSSSALKDAIVYADNKGALFVAAAGNEGKDNDKQPNYPSNYDVENVIAVAATDHRDRLASFSNYGATTVDLAAPGVSIYSTTPGNNFEYLNGTSMATPHVSGAAALIWAHYLPTADKDLVKYRLFGAVDYVRDLQNKMLLDGRLNVNNALTDKPLVAVIEKPMDTDDETGPYIVRASAIDDGSISSVKLYYRVTNGSPSSDTLNMLLVNSYVYKTGIPGAAKESTIEYKIFARDNNGNVTETRFYSFSIGETGGGGCCGAFAVTVDDREPSRAVMSTFLLNFLLFLGPPIFFKWKLRRRQ